MMRFSRIRARAMHYARWTVHHTRWPLIYYTRDPGYVRTTRGTKVAGYRPGIGQTVSTSIDKAV
jgi:hypothetical protein